MWRVRGSECAATGRAKAWCGLRAAARNSFSAPAGRHSCRSRLLCRPLSPRHGLAPRTSMRSSPRSAGRCRRQNTLYFYSFQKPCEELLRKASVDPAEAAEWAYYSGRWYLSDASDHCVTKAEFVAVQVSARTLVQKLDAAQSISNSSPAPAMPFGLAVDGKKLMSRFFQLRGSWVQEVASAAAAVVTDAELQADIKIIGRGYALQAAQFDSFYPRFVDALDAASQARGQRQNSSQTATSDSFRLLPGACYRLRTLLHRPSSLARRCGAPFRHLRPRSAGQLPLQLCLIPQKQRRRRCSCPCLRRCRRRRRRRCYRRLLLIAPPAYVAPRAEGAPARWSCASAQATAAPNRNELWIPFSTSTLGSHSPYPHLRCPPTCALSATLRTRMQAMSARPASHASLGRRWLAGLGMGKRMRRRGLVTALPCCSPRGRRLQGT